MKTKIFVSSISGLDYITHSPSVSVIPDRVIFSEYEEYEDGTELTAGAFYARYRNDKSYFNKVKVLPATLDTIEKMLDNAISNEYERFLFLLPSANILNYSDVLQELKDKKKKLDLYIYEAEANSYPLAYMALEADKMLKKDASLDEVYYQLDYLKDGYKLYLFEAESDVSNVVDHKIYDEDVLDMQIPGKIMTVTSKETLPIIINKGEKALERLIDEFLGDISTIRVLPFVVYSSKYSSFNNAIKSRILQSYPKLKTIKQFQLSAGVGVKYNENIVGLGYILMEERED